LESKTLVTKSEIATAIELDLLSSKKSKCAQAVVDRDKYERFTCSRAADASLNKLAGVIISIGSLDEAFGLVSKRLGSVDVKCV